MELEKHNQVLWSNFEIGGLISDSILEAGGVAEDIFSLNSLKGLKILRRGHISPGPPAWRSLTAVDSK